ncbi:MAG: ABC transporter ATP-binding protein [Planctomycetes bacterium]|nr:ABC transporter ATP-binding protein [Planctomycetota bacterium]
MNAPAIQLSQVTRQYTRGGETVKALDEFDLEIPQGGYYAIMGPSGSGKSTLLNLVGGLDRPDAGQVVVAGEDLNQLTSSELADFRANTIGFVFQGFNLLPVLTAVQNVELPLLLTPLSRGERRKQALHALELVGLSDRINHRPRQLSGGQEQRVAIARALATDPQLILADEPTGDLDRDSASSVLELLERLNAEFKKTIVMVTHDARAADSAGHVVHLDKGKLERIVDNRLKAPEAGAPAEQEA